MKTDLRSKHSLLTYLSMLMAGIFTSPNQRMQPCPIKVQRTGQSWQQG